MKNVFVLAPEPEHWQQLATLGDSDCRFHGVLDVPTLVEAPTIDFAALLDMAQRDIDSAGVPVDAIVAHWDFPTSVLVPVLCSRYGNPSPTVTSILKCEHKLWSRREQQQAIPEVVPRFRAFDPFDDASLDSIDLEYPFWIKPIKSFSSQLGFLIEHREDFASALPLIRQRIGRIADAFGQALAEHAGPESPPAVPPHTCLAEEVMSGRQIAPEGSMHNGELNLHGFFDMPRSWQGKAIDRLVYPADLDDAMKSRLHDLCSRYLKHIGFDNGCFNMEFMWDEERDQLRVIEVNPRISQSHSEMFIRVDGMSNHKVAVDVALGRKPVFRQGGGPCENAAKCMIPHRGDGYVRKTPSETIVHELERHWPDTRIKVQVREGMRLAEVLNQDSYSCILATLYMGGQSRADIEHCYQECLNRLEFGIEPVENDVREAG